jgi:hypothetical protein
MNGLSIVATMTSPSVPELISMPRNPARSQPALERADHAGGKRLVETEGIADRECQKAGP